MGSAGDPNRTHATAPSPPVTASIRHWTITRPTAVAILIWPLCENRGPYLPALGYFVPRILVSRSEQCAPNPLPSSRSF